MNKSGIWLTGLALGIPISKIPKHRYNTNNTNIKNCFYYNSYVCMDFLLTADLYSVLGVSTSVLFIFNSTLDFGKNYILIWLSLYFY